MSWEQRLAPSGSAHGRCLLCPGYTQPVSTGDKEGTLLVFREESVMDPSVSLLLSPHPKEVVTALPCH